MRSLPLLLLLLGVMALAFPTVATTKPARLRPPAPQRCLDGTAAGYPCHNVDLLAFVSSEELNPPTITGTSVKGNSIWGWAHPETGAEYALVGLRRGTAFVNVTEPTAPVVEGFLPTAAEETSREAWRDIKVYANHAFIVAETRPHGMQVVDLMQLPKVVQVAHYSGFASAHTLAINETSGFAYAAYTDTCVGLHIVDIREPASPRFAGCFDEDSFSHEAQCVTFPATSAYPNREICFAFNYDTLTIADVTDKAAMQVLARVAHRGAQGFAHQGWITPDFRYLLMNDESDETMLGVNTTTYIWDISDLAHPVLLPPFIHDTPAIDHNLYIRGQHAFLSNYTAGLRVLDLRDIHAVAEVGFFDIYPQHDNPSFNGSWGNYPFLPSGIVLVNGIEQGLFVLRFAPTHLWFPLAR